jgi:hypothetical protein
MKTSVMILALAAALGASGGRAIAQPAARSARQGAPPRALEEPGITPAEIRKMFDSYALMQAQDQLKITDEQFPKFLTRFKALQDLRRQTLMQRNRILQELRRLTNDARADESAMKERVRALADLDARHQTELQRAYEAIDQVLDVRQQARFRVFEEQMEQRMLQLITRARAANRPRP